jgi:hypothetical protein
MYLTKIFFTLNFILYYCIIIYTELKVKQESIYKQKKSQKQIYFLIFNFLFRHL